MTILNKLASQLERNDEQPNIELAYELVKENNVEGIKEIIESLLCGNKKIKQDCIKVIYEIGKLKPELISEDVLVFIELLKSPNNRLVWGAMQVISTIATLSSGVLMDHLHSIKLAIKMGSVITVDKGILTLAKLATVNEEYNEQIFPFLLEHLKTCRTKEIPQHAESTLIAVTDKNKMEFIKVLQEREQYLTVPQKKRVKKILTNL